MYNTDGFNERNMYIRNGNDRGRKLPKVDNSMVKMKIEENKTDLETVNQDNVHISEEARGDRENFVIQNHNLNNVTRPVKSNPVSDALNRNRFKKF